MQCVSALLAAWASEQEGEQFLSTSEISASVAAWASDCASEVSSLQVVNRDSVKSALERMYLEQSQHEPARYALVRERASIWSLRKK